MAETPNLEQAELALEEINLIRESWIIVDENKVENGKTIFVRLLMETPEIKQLFTFAKDLLTAEALRESEGLAKHAARALNYLGNAVQQLENKGTKEVISSFVQLGKRHQKYGVKSEYLLPLGECIIFMVRKALGNKFNDETEAAWMKLYTVISNSFTCGLQAN